MAGRATLPRCAAESRPCVCHLSVRATESAVRRASRPWVARQGKDHDMGRQTWRISSSGSIVDQRGVVLYEGYACNFTDAELRALCWLLNHGHDHLSWEEIEPLVAERVARGRGHGQAMSPQSDAVPTSEG
jgi:hypothetical protein